MFGLFVDDPEFEKRFLDRGGLLEKLHTETALVSLTVDAMQKEQGKPPAGPASCVPGPVTDLGSQILKLLAAQFRQHPNYRPEWQPHVELPRL